MWQSNATRPVVIVICVATCSPVLRAAPFSFDATPGRLPKSVVPLDCTIVVVPDVKARTLSGTETVTLRVSDLTDILVFNSLNQKLTDVRLDGQPASQVVSDDAQQLTTVTLSQARVICCCRRRWRVPRRARACSGLRRRCWWTRPTLTWAARGREPSGE
jgi:hypothetical protein